MILYFENRYRERRELGNFLTEEDAWREIKNFCDNHNFKINYVRSWVEKNEKWYDVGSHSEFFVLA